MIRYGFFNKYDISDLIPEKQKMTEEYLRSAIDWHISSLVHEKKDLETMYDYYHGNLDKERYKYLESNMGIGNPSCVEFIPLIRKHVDALIGELLRESVNPKVTCRDQKTLDVIQEQKKTYILKEYTDRIISQVQANIAGNKEDKSPMSFISEQEIEGIKKSMEQKWQSQFEISAQHVLTHFLQDREINYKEFLRTLFQDLLITGSCYYRVYADRVGEDPILEIVNPLDIFYNKNTNHPYVKQANRAVHRKFMTRQEALNRYGHSLSEDDKQVLFGNEIITASGEARFVVTRSQRQNNYLVSNTGSTVTDTKPSWYGDEDIITVYHVEWLANNAVEIEVPYDDNMEGDELVERYDEKKTKKIRRWRLDRYEGIRIGDYIYTMMGKSKQVSRPMDKKYRCYLSYNGISYTDRNGQPFSMVSNLLKLQDKYNILHFYRDNIIANANLPGPIIDVAAIPTFLGKSAHERLMKWQAYGKNGLYLINSAQQGQSHINTIYGGMQATLDANAVAALDQIIQSIEYTASQITGVFKERLGGIEQKDAVSNVKVGINQSFIITKQFFHMIDLMKRESLTDMVNIARFTYRDGKKGSVLLGGKQEIFSIDPNYFSMTDYDVHISETGEEIKDMAQIEAMAMELIKAQSADVDLVIDMITCKSLTEMKEKVTKHVTDNKSQNAQQMQQQIEQLEKELKSTQNANQQMEQARVQNDAERLKLDREKFQVDTEIKKDELRISEEFNDQKIEEIKRRTDIEQLEAVQGGDDKEVANI